mgnify:CR=1 FL=1
MAVTGDWYILFVKTGCEEKVAGVLNEKMDQEKSRAFTPRKKIIFRRKGVDHIYQEILFPGYVFIETEKTFRELSREVQYLVSSLKVVYRFLHYADPRQAALHEEEKKEIMAMCGGDLCLGNSKGIIEGGRIKILSGALVGKEAAIKRIDRHKRQAVIEMMLFGETREIVVALEILEVRKELQFE